MKETMVILYLGFQYEEDEAIYDKLAAKSNSDKAHILEKRIADNLCSSLDSANHFLTASTLKVGLAYKNVHKQTKR